jgi:O-acetyl-ADP-ribose deacetylase (regulator of RNase III)
MTDSFKIDNRVIRIMKGDITELDVDGFVYYARHDLALGSGYGGAIAVRGGPGIAEELKQFGPLNTTEVAVTSAGELKARHIIHAAGPRFQEEDLERKLRATIANVLAAAEQKMLEKLAFPAMGAGFYGVPLDLCARAMLGELSTYLKGQTGIQEVVICLNDLREYKVFEAQMGALTGAVGVRS